MLFIEQIVLSKHQISLKMIAEAPAKYEVL